MAKNDVILLDGIIDQRVADNYPSDQRGEVFELFALEEVLKDYDLSAEELESGWIDGRADGGLDGFYIFINGCLLDNLSEFAWPRNNAVIDVWLITCKHHDSFKQEAIDALLATFQELFDLTLDVEDLSGCYSSDLLDLRANFNVAYRRLAMGRPRLNFHIVYTSRGDSSQVGETVAARAQQVEAVFSNNFSSSTSSFDFVGATELIQKHRKGRSFSLTLPILEHLATGADSYVSLVKLDDYWRFVSDENGNLRRYLFDSNVRDYLGSSGVNSDIAQTLSDPESPDFWWLNNGVTILATNASMLGKTMQLQDIQIVNGLQTTETIFRHFQDGSVPSSERSVLVKILVSNNELVRDRIIRATNNQSPVELAALHATDKIQRDIEVILERNGWYYERRKNYFRNIGKPQARFVTPIYMASAVVALVFRNPTKAQRLKTKFMRKEESYEDVFSSSFPINVWPVLVGIFKSVDVGLSHLYFADKRRERFNSFWRPLVAFIAVSRRMGTFDYSTQELLQMDPVEISPVEVKEVWDLVSVEQPHFESTRKQNQSIAKTCCIAAENRFELGGIGVLDKRQIRVLPTADRNPPEVDVELIQSVRSLLPQQPWKPGVQARVAEQLGQPKNVVRAAIQRLIDDGVFNRQVDGVVYDSDDRIIAFDPERIGNLSMTSSVEATVE